MMLLQKTAILFSGKETIANIDSNLHQFLFNMMAA